MIVQSLLFVVSLLSRFITRRRLSIYKMDNSFGFNYLFFLTIILYSTAVAGDIDSLQQSSVIEEIDLEREISQEADIGLEDGKNLHLVLVFTLYRSKIM